MTEANITWLTKHVATGGDLSFIPNKAFRQMQELLSMGIGLVIDCRKEVDDWDIWSQYPDTEYLYLPVDDVAGGHLPFEHFDAAVYAARDVIEKGGTVFAHCHMGINRGPSTAMAILMDQGMTPESAFSLIRRERPIAGIAFAVDAVRAHYAREGWKADTAEWRVDQFIEHMDRVYPKSAQMAVRHTMRAKHMEDAQEMGMH